jgi:hypothetical protein
MFPAATIAGVIGGAIRMVATSKAGADGPFCPYSELQANAMTHVARLNHRCITYLLKIPALPE